MSKPKRTPIWIPEQQAAKKLGYNARVFRRKVVDGKLNIAFTNINGRKWQYEEKDIDNVLLKNSTFIA